MPPEAQHWDLIKAKLRPSPGEVGVEYRTGSVCEERAGGGEQGGNRGAGLEKKRPKGERCVQELPYEPSGCHA